MQLYSVQLITGKAEITGDKGMYPRASGGLGGSQTPAYFHRIITYSTCLINILLCMDFGISPKMQSCRFILPFRKNRKEYDSSPFHYEFFLFSTFSEK